jgi:hypothetical protein
MATIFHKLSGYGYLTANAVSSVTHATSSDADRATHLFGRVALVLWIECKLTLVMIDRVQVNACLSHEEALIYATIRGLAMVTFVAGILCAVLSYDDGKRQRYCYDARRHDGCVELGHVCSSSTSWSDHYSD